MQGHVPMGTIIPGHADTEARRSVLTALPCATLVTAWNGETTAVEVLPSPDLNANRVERKRGAPRDAYAVCVVTRVAPGKAVSTDRLASASA